MLTILRCILLICVIAVLAAGQQTTGALKGTVTDQLDSLVVGANVTVRNANGVVTSATSNSSGVYEFRRLAPGSYDLKIVAPGFMLFEEKEVEIRTREQTNTLNAQLDVAFEEQQVTVDDRNISTDSDNNAGAVVLRGRDLEALPNDPQALAAALQVDGRTSRSRRRRNAQIKVDGFSNGQIPPKEAIREVRINNNPFSAENEFPGWSGIEIFTQPGADKWHGSFSFRFQRRKSELPQPVHDPRARLINNAPTTSISVVQSSRSARRFQSTFGRYLSDANSIVNATMLDPVTLKPVT